MSAAVPLAASPLARPEPARVLAATDLDPATAGALDRLSLDCDVPSHAPALVEAQARDGLVADARRSFAWITSPTGAAAIPAFATNEPLWHLLAGEGVLRLAAALARRLPARPRSVVVGTPLCESGDPLLARGASLARELPHLVAGADRLAREHGALGVFWKDVPVGSDLDRALEAEGFAPFVSMPTARVDLRPFACLDDWLGSLAAVASTGDLRRKLRDAGLVTTGVREHLVRRHGAGAAREEARWAARAEAVAARLVHGGVALPGGARPPLWIARELQPTAELLAQLMPLYDARLATAEIRWEQLTPGFFARLVESPDARLVVAWLGDVPVGFSIGLRRGASWLCLRSGIHPALARHFSVSMLLVLIDLELALAEGCARLLLGPTAYAMKARLGACFAPTVARMRLAPPLRAATPIVAAAIDAANRRAGVHRLHLACPDDSWQPRAAPTRRER